MKDFFISYNKADKVWALGLNGWLVESGYSTLIQSEDFGPGSNFVLQMHEAAQQASRTIAVLSPDYLTSSFTAPEWAAALARDPKGENQSLIPVRVRECHVDGLLSQIVYIDLVGLRTDEAKARLLSGVRFVAGGPTKGVPPRKNRPNQPSSDLEASPIEQSISGDNNIQVGRDLNVVEKHVVKKEITREEGEISDSQALEIRELIVELSKIDELAGRKPSYGKWYSALQSRFRCTSYKKLRQEHFEDAVSWLKQEKARARPKLRRTNNEQWRTQIYRSIWPRWKALGREKEEIYPFAYEKLGLKKPISSLKDLGERNLEKLLKIVSRM